VFFFFFFFPNTDFPYNSWHGLIRTLLSITSPLSSLSDIFTTCVFRIFFLTAWCSCIRCHSYSFFPVSKCKIYMAKIIKTKGLLYNNQWIELLNKQLKGWDNEIWEEFCQDRSGSSHVVEPEARKNQAVSPVQWKTETRKFLRKAQVSIRLRGIFWLLEAKVSFASV
jgi:hypothetical protein